MSWIVGAVLPPLAPALMPMLLTLPAQAAGGPAAQAARMAEWGWVDYRVRPGDTLIGLRGRVMVSDADWRIVQRLNRIADPRRMMPNSLLRIPVSLLIGQSEAVLVLSVRGQVQVEPAAAGIGAGAGAARPLAADQRLGVGDRISTGPRSSVLLQFADGSELLLRADSRMVVERSLRFGDGFDDAGPAANPVPASAATVPAPSASTSASTASASAALRDIRIKLESGNAETRVPPRPANRAASAGAASSAGSAASAGSATAASQARRFELRTPMVNLGVRGTEFRAAAGSGDAGAASRLEVTKGEVLAAARPVGAGLGVLATAAGVSAPQPLLPPPQLDALPARIERLPLQFDWPAVPGTANYRVDLFDAADARTPRAEGRFNTPEATWTEDLADGVYRVRVRAVAASGLEGRDAERSFELDARPEPPLVHAPQADAEVIEAAPHFSWARNPDAQRYRFQLAADAQFSAPLVDRDDLTAHETQAELPMGTHFWRVGSIARASDGRDDLGPWGDARRVTRLPPPPVPTPSTADDGALVLSWPAASKAAAGYGLQISAATDQAFAQPLVDVQVDQPRYLLRDAAPGVYYVRVRTFTADGLTGPWGRAQQVEVTAPPARPWWLLLLPLVLLL